MFHDITIEKTSSYDKSANNSELLQDEANLHTAVLRSVSIETESPRHAKTGVSSGHVTFS